MAVRDRALHDRARVRRELRLQQAHDAVPELLHVRRPAPARDGDARAEGALRGRRAAVRRGQPARLPAGRARVRRARARRGRRRAAAPDALRHRDHPRRAARLRQPLRAAARRARRRHAEAHAAGSGPRWRSSPPRGPRPRRSGSSRSRRRSSCPSRSRDRAGAARPRRAPRRRRRAARGDDRPPGLPAVDRGAVRRVRGLRHRPLLALSPRSARLVGALDAAARAAPAALGVAAVPSRDAGRARRPRHRDPRAVRVDARARDRQRLPRVGGDSAGRCSAAR